MNSQKDESTIPITINFLIDLSHSLRTSMDAIIGMSNLLTDTHLKIQQREIVEVIRQSAAGILVDFENRIDLLEKEAGKLRTSESEIALTGLTEEIKTTFAVRAKEKGLEFVCNIDQNVPSLLLGECNQLKKILNSLVNNAIEHSSKGSVSLNISLDHESEVYATLLFTIKDTGTGISENKLLELISALRKTEFLATQDPDSFPLCIARLNTLVKKLGGKIQIQSERDKGSTFQFTAILQKSGKTKKRKTPITDEQKKSVRILVVEDHIINQKLYKRILENLGYHADIVINGKQALALLENETYDLVLMDIQMPVMNGYEATKIIRDHNSHVKNHEIPIIAVTAHALEGDREKCIAVGMDDYVPKPIDITKLKEVIERQLVVSKFFHR